VEELQADAERIAVGTEDLSDQLLQSMARHGIENLWFVSGTELAFFQEAFVKGRTLGRRVSQVRTVPHEGVAVACAGGESRVTGRPSSVVAHVDVGLLNMGGAIHNCWRGRYPVLLMSGYAPTTPPGSRRGSRDSAIQWVQQIRDQGEIVRQYTKWDYRLAGYEVVDAVVGRAVQIMTSPPPGPAYLTIPREVAMQPGRADEPWADLPLQAAAPGRPDPEQLDEVVAALLAAACPVLSTDRPDPRACAWLLRLAEFVGAPVVCGDNLFSLPPHHPLARGGPNAFRLPAEADMVIAVETPVPWVPQGAAGPRPKVAHLGLDPLVSATPVNDFPCDWALPARSDLALADLVERVEARATASQREAFLARRRRLEEEGRQSYDRLREQAAADEHAGRMSRGAVFAAVARELGPDWVFFHEMVETPLLGRTRPGTLFGNAGSSIGWSVPAAIGAKAARPDLPVAALCGDGAWFFANPAACLWTARRHSAPVVIVVMNNGGYRTGTLTVAQSYPEGYAVRLKDFTGGWLAPPAPEFAAEAAAVGCFGVKVTDARLLAGALQQAVRAVTVDGVPALVEACLPQIGT
jgi:acetolactate synthase-1/2/3 large subunit